METTRPTWSAAALAQRPGSNLDPDDGVIDAPGGDN